MARIRRDPKSVPAGPPWNPQAPPWISLAAIVAGLLASQDQGLPVWATIAATCVALVGAFSVGKSIGESRPDPSSRERIRLLEYRNDHWTNLATGLLERVRGTGEPTPAERPDPPAPSEQPTRRPPRPLTVAQRTAREMDALDADLPGDERAGGLEAI